MERGENPGVNTQNNSGAREENPAVKTLVNHDKAGEEKP